MGKIYDQIDETLADFIKEQKMFFVATAPLSPDGHINMSPKGYDSFVILDPHTVAYLDLGGSGIETQAHITENSRITLMFCAFEGKANILRIYGRGEAFDFDHPDYPDLLKLFPGYDKARAVIRVNVTRIQDSCGWGIPFYDYVGPRDQLRRWSENISESEWKERRYARNAESIDGLPGLKRPKD